MTYSNGLKAVIIGGLEGGYIDSESKLAQVTGNCHYATA